jgi:hypothetical protein
VKIALIHFHLKTGGVTSVIRDQVRTLQRSGFDFMVLTGDSGDLPVPAETIRIPELAYDRDVPGNPEAHAIADDILSAVHRHWPQGADIVHVHNPTLAKNRLLQAVLKQLQINGQRLLCQIHDFAEDGRPDAFFESPYVGDCHYAVINPRDMQLLIDAGLNPAGCHLLPNAVSPSPPSPVPGEIAAGTILYPVRAIRRKNIGEAILLSLFFNADEHLAVTLPPNSPKDIEQYNQWRAFVHRHRLDVQFEAGLSRDFSRLMGGCRNVLTTSITEGFGFSFLEAWLNGKALWGRALPQICQGFTGSGLRLDHLYVHLKIPLDWLDARTLSRQWEDAMTAALKRFGLTVTPATAAAGWQKVSEGHCIDFGLLDESFQRAVIRRLMDDKPARRYLIDLNPFLGAAGPPEDTAPLIAHNRSVIEKHYNDRQYARRLKNIYARVLDTSVSHRIDKQILARAFLAPHGFSLLKWDV